MNKLITTLASVGLALLVAYTAAASTGFYKVVRTCHGDYHMVYHQVNGQTWSATFEEHSDNPNHK